MGAIASGGVRVLNHKIVEELQIPSAVIEMVEIAEKREVERREYAYRRNRPSAEVPATSRSSLMTASPPDQPCVRPLLACINAGRGVWWLACQSRPLPHAMS
jgi:hypothetical protein